MSRLTSSINVQWSAKSATICVFPWAQNNLTYLVSDQKFLMRELKKSRNWEKNKKSGSNTKTSSLITGTLIAKKSEAIIAVVCDREWCLRLF